MLVTDKLILKTHELSRREWRVLFDKLRYSDDDGEIYEPWRVIPANKEVWLPRGAWFLIPDHVEYHDFRLQPECATFDFKGKLDSNGFSGQKAALKRMLEEEQGLIIAQPGFGKTEVAVAFFSCAEVKTLVIVHTQDILNQWVERCKMLVPDAKVGIIQGDLEMFGDITITTVQTFRKKLRDVPRKFKDAFGAVILDEAHHAPAGTFDEVMGKMSAKYRFGFTATLSRADGKHPYMKLIIGPVIYRKKFKSKVPVEVFPVKSHNFKYRWRGSWDWRGLVNALISDTARNQVIAAIADGEIMEGNSTLVLSREIRHLDLIAANMTQPHAYLIGSFSKEVRNTTLDKFRSGEIKCLLATQLADEALDVPILSRIILTYPGKHDGRIIQQVGRALREHPLKTKAIVYDVVDDKVGILRHQWMQRKQAYRKMKIPVRKLRVK